MPLLPLLLQVAAATPSPPPEAAVAPPIVAEAAASAPTAADTCARGRVLESLSFPSAALGGEMRYSVYLPAGYERDRRRYPVVYLLHGHSGDETDWIRVGEADRTADRLIAEGDLPPVILIMPDARNSWYVDSDPVTGSGAWERAVAEDLVAHVDETWRTVPERRGRAVAGLSMGGFGALHLALRHPDRFAAAASLSGVLGPEPPERIDVLEGAFGDPFDPERWNSESPFGLLRTLPSPPPSLPVYLTTGDDDGLRNYRDAALLHDALRRAGLASELRVTDGGHGWAVWSRELPAALVFLGEVFRSRRR